MKKKIPELLAPAGGMSQLVSAVENGADAVYLGGALFNARIHADNFKKDEMRRAIDYAHLRNVDVHVAMNTLLKDEELLPALEYAVQLYEMGADAIIVQDLGLAELLRQYLPELPLHLSTQGSVYNRSGVKKAKTLGFSRVVLARELSLEEIRQIAKDDICELEVFVHGALCICYSGQCQMSRILGGGQRSGNRGMCAQPCRLPYRNSRGNSVYALSPRDLCAVDLLGELTEAGVASLKIEGRMKSPEYVAAVTGIYRKYLDHYASEGNYQVSMEDRDILMQVFNRGGFTSGYLRKKPGKELLSGCIPKHQGIFAGTVVADVPGTGLVDIKPSRPIALGDGIEIHSTSLVGNVITFRQQKRDGVLRVGDLKGKVRSGDEVYKITDASLMRRLKKTYDEGGPEGIRHKKKIPVSMHLQVKIGQEPVLNVQEGGVNVTVRDRMTLAEPARKRPLDSDIVENQLKKTGGTPFCVNALTMEIEKGCSLPLSSLNRLRREALALLEENKCQMGKRVFSGTLPNRLSFEKHRSAARIAFYFFRGASFQSFDFRKLREQMEGEPLPVRYYVPLRWFMRWECLPQDEGETVIPYILNISKGRLDQYLEEHFEQIVEKTRNCGIAVGNLGWISEFVSAGVPLYADYGLNLYNQKTAEVLRAQGMETETMSHETWTAKDGPIPLMITEYMPFDEILTDRKNKSYRIVYNDENDKSLLFQNENGMSLNALIQKARKRNGEVRVYIP